MEITDKERKALANKHIETPGQLQRWFPIRYIDNTTETGARRDLEGKHVVIIGTLISFDSKINSRGINQYDLIVEDRISGEKVRFWIFGQDWKYGEYYSYYNQTVIVAGTLKVHEWFGFSLGSVDLFSNKIQENMTVVPVYSRIKGIKEKRVKEIVSESLHEGCPEVLPLDFLKALGLPTGADMPAMKYFPRTMADVASADRRILFDDLLYIAGHFVITERAADTGDLVITSDEKTMELIERLPFKLTNSQLSTYKELTAVLKEKGTVHSLVQGDVGCGKTIVAFLMSHMIVENGYQAVIMAPTKILAGQHYEKLCALIPDEKDKIVLLSGGKITKKQLAAIQSGEVKYIIGTHAVLSDSIEYCNLGLVVIDEEHKFGVEQRGKLEALTSMTAHISMTATPIPRTLALAVYGGNVHICNITDKPAGRSPVKTIWDDGNGKWAYIKDALSRNEQVYVVCPAIEPSDDPEEDPLPMLTTHEALMMYRRNLPGVQIEELTGKTGKQETEEILGRFKNNETQILVSTTVVEVAVDVPNATLIIIENSERFGLAQMHQLRGRVGRGNKPSTCLLISEQMNDRIDVLCSTTDGFEISRMDLTKMRHSGDLFGEEQSGINVYVEEMLAFPDHYKQVLEIARRMPNELLEKHIWLCRAVFVKGHKKVVTFGGGR